MVQGWLSGPARDEESPPRGQVCQLVSIKVLIAEDDPVSCSVLNAFLSRWGYEVVVATDGTEAWEILHQPEAPRLAILDWIMPGITGVDICRRLREEDQSPPPYVILLTSRAGAEDVVEGLEAGADDYISKPFNREELRARTRAAARLVELQSSLHQRVAELEEALASVKTLQGLLPICSYCKKIRTDGNYWQQVEAYISEHSEATFSHGICPACYETHVKPQLAKAQEGT